MTDPAKLELDSVRVLIDQSRDGDRGAQEELISQVQSYISMMADKNLNDSIRANVGASDIVQQTLIKMVNGIDQFQGKTTAEFFGWLNQIIKHEAIRSKRDLTRMKRDVRRQRSLADVGGDSQNLYDPADGLMTPRSNAIANERVEVFHRALQNLSLEYATVIRLRNLQQLPFKEIAETMNRSVDSVSKLWFRAVIKFEKELRALDDDPKQ